MNFAGTSSSPGVTYLRPGFQGRRVRVETEIVALGERRATTNVRLRYIEKDGSSGKVICEVVHEVLSMAQALRGAEL